jgi:hypothetical protein
MEKMGRINNNNQRHMRSKIAAAGERVNDNMRTGGLCLLTGALCRRSTSDKKDRAG